MPSRPRQHHSHGYSTKAEARAEHDRYRGSARDRGYDAAWDKTSKAYRKAHPLCEDCEDAGMVVPVKEVDHIVPKKQGGGDDEANLRSRCKSCHQAKTRADLKKYGSL